MLKCIYIFWAPPYVAKKYNTPITTMDFPQNKNHREIPPALKGKKDEVPVLN
jgi:hypothetical protein